MATYAGLVTYATTTTMATTAAAAATNNNAAGGENGTIVMAETEAVVVEDDEEESKGSGAHNPSMAFFENNLHENKCQSVLTTVPLKPYSTMTTKKGHYHITQDKHHKSSERDGPSSVEGNGPNDG